MRDALLFEGRGRRFPGGGPWFSAGLAAHAAGVGLGAVVGGHRAAVVGIAAAAVQGGISPSVAGEVQRPAVDGQVSVGVQAVSVRYYGDGPAVHGDEAVLTGGEGIPPAAEAGAVCPAGGVVAIVVGGDGIAPVLHGDGQALDASSTVTDRPSTPS